MTRPPGGAGFAQFFPAAPRAVKDRMTERERAERAKKQSHESSETPSPNSQIFTSHASSRADQPDGLGRPPDVPFSDTSLPPTDDSESIPGDIPNGTRSASSHASTVSSIFSAPASALQAAPSASTRPPAAIHSPPTSSDSPLHSAAMSVAKPLPSHPNNPDISSREGYFHATDSPASTNGQSSVYAGRVSARNPARAIQGIRCIYDPLIDRNLAKSSKKDTKPQFKEFGLVRDTYMILYTTHTLYQRGGRHRYAFCEHEANIFSAIRTMTPPL